MPEFLREAVEAETRVITRDEPLFVVYGGENSLSGYKRNNLALFIRRIGILNAAVVKVKSSSFSVNRLNWSNATSADR